MAGGGVAGGVTEVDVRYLVIRSHGDRALEESIMGDEVASSKRWGDYLLVRHRKFIACKQVRL